MSPSADVDVERHAAAPVVDLDVDGVGVVDEGLGEVLEHGGGGGRRRSVVVDLVVVASSIVVVDVVLVELVVVVVDVVVARSSSSSTSSCSTVVVAHSATACLGSVPASAGDLSSFRTRSVGWAPLRASRRALSLSIATTDGSWRGW